MDGRPVSGTNFSLSDKVEETGALTRRLVEVAGVEETKWVLGPDDGDSSCAVTLEFEHVYRTYAHRVEACIRAIVGDDGESEELSQEVFVQILAQLRRGRTPRNLGAWIEQQARSLAMRHVTRRAALREVPLGAMPLAKRADPRPWANLDRLEWVA